MYYKFNSGKIFRFFVLIIPVLFLVACSGGGGGSDDTVNGGEVLGQVTVNGADASIIGTAFSPTIDASSNINGAILVALTEVSSNNGRTIRLLFTADGVPDILTYDVLLNIGTTEAKTYLYRIICSSGEDCSGFSVNTETKVVTLDDTVFLNDSTVSTDNNDATGSVTLKGTLNYDI